MWAERSFVVERAEGEGLGLKQFRRSFEESKESSFFDHVFFSDQRVRRGEQDR